jgi:COP9 signalosome complex subunit 3
MALDQFVSAVQTLSTQGNYAELCDHLNKSQELLVRNPSQLDSVLEILDMSSHSLGYLAVLMAKLGQENLENFGDVLAKCDSFVSACNLDQIRFSPNSLSDLCHQLTNELVKRDCAIRGISIVSRAVRKLQVTPTCLTPAHSDLAKLCLVSKCFSPALQFLDVDINQISKENGQFDAQYLLLYYYYGGCIYTALKRFERAFYMFEIAVTCPTAAVSHIMLEAYKKYQLVGLLVHGDKPKSFKENLALPKYTSPIVGKFLKPLCSAYHELVTAYYNSNNSSELSSTVSKYTELLNADNNMGLVQQVVASQTRTNIRRLTRTFITLSLADLASRVGLSSPQEVEKELVGMIEAGSIHATISQQDGMVRFDTNPESYSSPKMLQLLEEEVRLAMMLDKQVTQLEEDMMVSPAYVKKMAGVRGEEDEEGGGGGNRMAASSSGSNAVSSGSSKLPGYSM